MKNIQLSIRLSDDLGVKGITIDYNDTDLESDSELVKRICFTLLKSIELNKEDIMVQDLLNSLEITKS